MKELKREKTDLSTTLQLVASGPRANFYAPHYTEARAPRQISGPSYPCSKFHGRSSGLTPTNLPHASVDVVVKMLYELIGIVSQP